MMTQLEEAKNMESEEKRKMEEEIRIKQEEIEEIRNVVEAKEKEATNLQVEVNLSKQKLEETAEALAASMAVVSEVQESNGRESSSSSSVGEQHGVQDIPDIIVDPVEDRVVE